MKLTASQIERFADAALTRTGLAMVAIWVVAGTIWWQALA